jgi:hypothetical protein
MVDLSWGGRRGAWFEVGAGHFILLGAFAGTQAFIVHDGVRTADIAHI